MEPPAGSSALAAVLWDMDGTLVDTEPYWLNAEFDLVAENGGRWDPALPPELVGHALEQSARVLQERCGLALTVEQIVDALLEKVLLQLADEGVPWRPGAVELVHELRAASVPCALVTMSWRRMVDVVLDALPPGTFSVVVTGDEVEHGKPHPEAYLRAAAALEVPPSACVAIEDSVPGLRSAEAAGVRVIAVEAHLPLPAAAGRSRLPTLAGVGVADVRRIAAGEVVDLVGTR